MKPLRQVCEDPGENKRLHNVLKKVGRDQMKFIDPK